MGASLIVLMATLVDPPGPVIALVSNNPTACGTATGSIVLTGLTNGNSYVINFSKNGTPQTAITQTASGGSVAINGLVPQVHTLTLPVRKIRCNIKYIRSHYAFRSFGTSYTCS